MVSPVPRRSKPETRADAFVADRRDIAAGIGKLLDEVACGRRSGPCVPTAEGHVIGTPLHLRGELRSCRLHVLHKIARYRERLYDEVGFVRSGNEPAL